ncbi:MAG: LysR substrate-binding domain-containing protein [bacterium]
MDLNQLRWFTHVADGVTVTEVSDLDRASQSGVSRALARLEAEVGMPLLQRAGRTLRMTRAGATFKPYVDKALHSLDDGLAAVSQQTSPESGTVAIAFQPSLGAWLVPTLVSVFRREHPDVRFDLRQVRDKQSARLVATGEIDLEITTIRPRLSSVRWRPLATERLGVAVPADHEAADRESVGLAEFRDATFVALRESYQLRRVTDLLCREAGFTPTVAFEGGEIDTLIGFVTAGLGVAVVPLPRPVAGAATSVRYLPITDRDAIRQIGIAVSADRPLLPAAANFHAAATRHLSRLA